MSKLRLGTYLKILDFNKVNNKTSGQRKILNALVSSICNETIIISAPEVTKIKTGIKDLEGTIQDKIQAVGFNNPPHYYENFKSKVLPLLHPGKLNDISKILAYIIYMDDQISSSYEIDYVSKTKKENLHNISNPSEFIAGVFLYVLQCTNNVHCEEYSNSLTPDFCREAIISYDTLINKCIEQSSSMDSDLISQANAFIIKYENCKDLIPLCQIANIINPTHNHVNEMYTDYCKCSKSLQKQIMETIDCAMIEADEINLVRLLSRFGDEAEEKELCAPYQAYMFRQYCEKSLSFEAYIPDNPNPRCFPVLPSKLFPNRTTSDLSCFIDDYLFAKGSDNELPVPLLYLDAMFNFTNPSECPAEKLIFWLDIFIISGSYSIHAPSEIVHDKGLVIPNLDDMHTLEDIYYLALLRLYDIY